MIDHYLDEQLVPLRGCFAIGERGRVAPQADANGEYFG